MKRMNRWYEFKGIFNLDFYQFNSPRACASHRAIFHHQRFTFIFNLDAIILVSRKFHSWRANAIIRSGRIYTMRWFRATETAQFAFIDINTKLVLVKFETSKALTFEASDCVDTLLMASDMYFEVWIKKGEILQFTAKSAIYEYPHVWLELPSFVCLWCSHSLISIHLLLSFKSISNPFRHEQTTLRWLSPRLQIWLQPPLSIEHESASSQLEPSIDKILSLEQLHLKPPAVFVQISLQLWTSVSHSSTSTHVFISTSRL